MTNDQINAAIDTLLGPSPFVGLKKRGLWHRPGGRGYTICESEAGRYTREQAKKREYPHDEPVTIHEFSRPDYCDSLDACREFEDKINGDEVSLYEYWLGEITGSTSLTLRRSFVGDRMKLICATSRQRCEAYLRMKGHWRD